jgi:hypothetical protein
MRPKNSLKLSEYCGVFINIEYYGASEQNALVPYCTPHVSI